MTRFQSLLEKIPQMGLEHHRQTLLENSRRNVPYITRTIREIAKDPRPALIVSAGPSLYREKILSRIKGFKGCLIATDGAYIQCLKAGLRPDWVMTIDPHPTRIVRWFGDPSWEETEDDYFRRQDLDLDFREDSGAENQKNIALVDANRTNLVMGSASPQNVVLRTQAFQRFWFAPLVDDPHEEGITSDITSETNLPALNTGGTVGTCAWVFAHQILKSPSIAVVGMDFGYYMDTPFRETQEWNLLKDEIRVQDFYPWHIGHWGPCYASPTYHWYLGNFLDLLEASDSRVTNCSGHGLLQGKRVDCMELEQWLASSL